MTSRRLAVIGSGLIGRSWVYLFARAGHEVRVCDEAVESVEAACEWLAGELPADLMANVRFCPTLDETVAGAHYVQECVSERVEVKRAIFGRMLALAPGGCIFASSTSALLPDAIFAGLVDAERCLVAHPANPPHVLPIVELVPGSDTSQETVEAAAALMGSLGQDVIRLKRGAPGFVLNRLQSALVEEALSLVAAGIADPDDIDRTVRSGLGLRWAFVGPFETMDLNSRGGFELYARTLGPALADSAPGGPETSLWRTDAPSKVASARRRLLEIAEIPRRQRWLAGKIRSLRALKTEDEPRFGER